jgi:hypothetical protein
MNPQNSIRSAPAEDTGPGSGAQSGGVLTDTKQKIAQTARDTAAKVKAATSDTVAKAKSEAARVATEKKETAANRIGGYSEAIRDTARSIEEKGDPNIAWFTQQAADKLQGVADYMRNSDFACLRGDCEGIARRHPAVFFGGMFFAGLLLGNMMKASRRRYDESQGEFDYDRTADTEWSEGRDDGLSSSSPSLSDAERGAAGI